MSLEEDEKKYSFIKPDPELKANLLAFGYECEKGWTALLSALFYELNKLINEKYPEFKDDLRVLQVKEKWGRLCVYINFGSDEIFDLLDKYEDISAHVCEHCGASGETKEIKGWYSTLCENCQKERMKGVL